MKFEIFFLGTSAGIPSLERNMPCIAIRFYGKVFLFDVGECCQRQLMKYKVGLGRIKGIFISHLHLDHFLGVFGLIETLRFSGVKELEIFAPSGFSNLLINRWDFLKIHRIKQGELKRIEDVSIKAFKVKHLGKSYGFVIQEDDRIKFDKQKAERLGIKGRMFSLIKERGELMINGRVVKLEEISYKVKGRKIVYSGDAMYDKNLIEFAKDADVLIHEATFLDLEEQALNTRHSTVKDAAMAAKEANVKKLVLTHISARYKNEELDRFVEEAKKYFDGEVIIAHDGLKLEI